MDSPHFFILGIHHTIHRISNCFNNIGAADQEILQKETISHGN